MPVPSVLVFASSDPALDPGAAVIRDPAGNVVPSREIGARMDRIAAGLMQGESAGLRQLNPAAAAARAEPFAARLHDEAYLAFVAREGARAYGSAPTFAEEFAAPGVAQDTPVEPGAWSAALTAMGLATASAEALAGGDTACAYALCRPPGHHAGRSFCGGYCLLNNAAAAALALRDAGFGPVAVIDTDFHIGNGTADCLLAYPDIAFGSVHCSTESTFPHRPELAPRSPAHRYLPFADTPSERDFLEAVARLLDHVRSWGARCMVLSIGYDVIAGDPHGGWELPPSVFRGIGRLVGERATPVCVVQEGGYRLERLADCAANFVIGLENALARSPAAEQ